MRNVLASLLLLISAFCPLRAAQPKAIPAEISATDQASIRRMVVEMQQAWNAHDADAYAAQFTPDAEHVNAYGMWWRGRREIAEAMQFVLSRIYATNPISADQVLVQPLAKNVAIVRYRWRLQSYTDPDGTRHENPQGRVTQVLVKHPEGWRIRTFQSTFINPNVRQVR